MTLGSISLLIKEKRLDWWFLMIWAGRGEHLITPKAQSRAMHL